MERLLKVCYAHKKAEAKQHEKNLNTSERFTEKDAILITYGDIIRNGNEPPLKILADFCKTYLKSAINTIHILPFFPYSSDRGFAVKDFEEVDHNLGTWEDISLLNNDFKLMFDGVFNHISSKSKWFQRFKNGDPYYSELFIVFSTSDVISDDHLKLIVRPRTSDVLTEVKTINGTKSVWTTFSPDQIDLNFKSPRVLIKMVDILLQYVWRGADIIRLDAVTYLWSELGTECVHLKETHTLIKLFRDILNIVAPHVSIVTETNVPHEQNITYFGKGNDEAQMVYNFALPPLVLHSFQNENTEALSKWADSLENTSNETTYFNFLDSHDGIGIMPIKGILSDKQIENMSLKVLEHGGFISYKTNKNGTSSPYELNITWYSAINRNDLGESTEIQIKRFLSSRSIALIIQGVPGIYIHSFFGSINDADAVLEERSRRSINRKIVDEIYMTQLIENPETTTYSIINSYRDMLIIRNNEKSFHPNAPQKSILTNNKIFSIMRSSMDGEDNIICLTNISNSKTNIIIDTSKLNIYSSYWKDLLSDIQIQSSNNILKIKLAPYDIIWLKSQKI